MGRHIGLLCRLRGGDGGGGASPGELGVHLKQYGLPGLLDLPDRLGGVLQDAVHQAERRV